MSDSDTIFHGPEMDFEVFNGSAAEYVHRGILRHPKDLQIQINGETGEKQTLEEAVTLALSVGQGLKERGLQQGDVILLAANHSVHTNAVVLGAILHNMVLFPIDPTSKTLEFEHYLRMSNPKIIFCKSKCLPYICAALDQLSLKLPVFVLDGNDTMKEIRAEKFSNVLINTTMDSYKPPPVKNPKDEVILIISSSGTTGLSKGVMVTHRNFCFATELNKNNPSVVNQDLYLQGTQVYWVTGLNATFFSYVFGTPRVYVGNVSGSALLKAIHGFKPQWTFLTPGYLEMILDHPDFSKFDLSSLTVITTGGTALPPSMVSKLLSQWPVTPMLAQLYGASEITGAATTPDFNIDRTSVGKICMGLSVKVIDVNTGRSLGTNQLGEIIFKSKHGMMKGYMNNPVATKEAFTEDESYRTADLGYITEEGNLFITDRIKDIIKCKNIQVSPSELEDAIRRVDGVVDVGVVGVPHDEEEDSYQPVALVVRKEGTQVTEQQIITYIADNLSEHKQLSGGVHFVKFVPRTYNGKVKRMTLKEMIPNTA